MFTGIIQEIGLLKRKTRGPRGIVSFEISAKKNRPGIGASIAVNGVCLTVTKKTQFGFCVDAVPETLKRTNLGSLLLNSPLNLEGALRLTDRFEGHIVTGHIDGVGKILKNSSGELKIAFPKKMATFVVEKGSIAVNGVSLTVAQVRHNAFTVALIPFTQKNTNLGLLKKGDFVNLEIDIIVRYLKNFYGSRHRSVGVQ